MQVDIYISDQENLKSENTSFCMSLLVIIQYKALTMKIITSNIRFITYLYYLKQGMRNIFLFSKKL